MLERIARIVVLVVGVLLSNYVAATPGDQILAAIGAGVCIGITVAFIIVEP